MVTVLESCAVQFNCGATRREGRREMKVINMMNNEVASIYPLWQVQEKIGRMTGQRGVSVEDGNFENCTHAS